MNKHIRTVLGAGALLVVLGLAGCSVVMPVAPWQKGTLARPEMRFGTDRLDGVLGEHVYSSKEAASGGTGDAGGGCGCK